MEERCVVCGEIIPEGRQICRACMNGGENGKMKTISPEKYVEGVNSIYTEKPEYQEGHDGSDGKCDCIGMCRGGLEREGVTGVTNMRGTNQAARKAIRNLQKISSEKQLRLGDVVLKVRDKDDKNMPLPDRYRKGGEDFDPDVGETNFTHIGTVTKTNPLEITHMTSPTAKKDTKLNGWTWTGNLPWVERSAEPDPGVEWATVWAEKGSTVKMRAKPSALCRLYWDVPIGSQVVLTEPGEKWSAIIWAGQSGYMMSRFLITGGATCTVTIKGLNRKTAEEIVQKYGGEITGG